MASRHESFALHGQHIRRLLMKKKIMSLVLTGALTLSTASTVFASAPQGKNLPPVLKAKDFLLR